MTSALAGPWWKRAAWSQLMIDESTGVGSAQTDHRWRRYGYLCAGLAIFVTWNLTTFIGAAALSSSGDVMTTWGIDATIPAAFLALLWPRLADAGQRRSSLAGGLVALTLVPFAPPGLPILASAFGVLAGGRQPRAETAT